LSIIDGRWSEFSLPVRGFAGALHHDRRPYQQQVADVAVLRPVNGKFSPGTNPLYSSVAGNTGKPGSAGSIAGVAEGGSGDLFFSPASGVFWGENYPSPRSCFLQHGFNDFRHCS
jgi:hypothetical protein